MTVKDLIEDWIQMRSALQRQVQAIQKGELQTGGKELSHPKEAMVSQLKSLIEELNSLLKQYAGQDSS